MRFLVDEAVSWKIASALNNAAYNALHVRGCGLGGYDDEVIFEHAAREERIIVTQDMDFVSLLHRLQSTRPSVVLLRMRDGRPEVQAHRLIAALPIISESLSWRDRNRQR